MRINKILDKSTPTVEQLAAKYKVDEKKVRAELDRGIRVEMEHTTHKATAREIALDHLGERLDYYQQLAKIDEVRIDNVNGIGSVPMNQNVDYRGMRVLMRPRTFLQLAHKLSRERASSVDHIKQELEQGGAIGAPWLYIDIPEEWDQGDLTRYARVVGHEGRNRMYAVLETEGNQPVEVHLFFSGEIRARHLTPAWKKELNQGLRAQGGGVVLGPLFEPMNLEEQQLEEVFQDPVPASWISLHDGSYYTKVMFRGHKVNINVYDDSRVHDARYVFEKNSLEFNRDGRGYEIVFSVGDRTDVTSLHGAESVPLFGVVIGSLRHLLESKPWDYLYFRTEDEEKDDLYYKLAQRFAKETGSRVLTLEGAYVIAKPSMFTH